MYLTTVIEFLGADRDIASIGVADVQAYSSWLAEIPAKGHGWKKTRGTLGPGTRRQHLNSLSNLYRRAAGEQYVPPGYNPVAGMMDKPTPDPGESACPEVYEAALFLEAACIIRRSSPALSMLFSYPLV